MKKSYSTNFLKKPNNSTLGKYFSLQKKYIKTNEQLNNFIKGTNGKINISKIMPNFNIKVGNNSLIEIFHKINDKYLYIQDYLEIIIISQNRETISLESKENYDKYINLLNQKNTYNVIKIKNTNNNNKIKLSEKSLKLIFKLLGIKFDDEVFNYIQLTIYQEITAYHFEDYQNLEELLYNIYNNNFGKNNFYVYNTKKEIISPISNYSIKKIIDMKNTSNNTNNKYFIFKIKDKIILLFEEKNKKFLDTLLNQNDYKFIYNKFYKNEGLINKWTKLEKNNSLSRIKKPNLMDLENFLLSAEELLNGLPFKIQKCKNDFNEKILNENNHFIQIKDINHNIKYVNNQYIQYLYEKMLEYDKIYCKYIIELKIKDYLNEDVFISVNNEKINNYFKKPVEEKYICFKHINNKFLVKKQLLENLLKNLNILNKKYKIKIVSPKEEEKEFCLNEINIDELNEIQNKEGIINLKNPTNKIKYVKKQIKKEGNNNNISNNKNNNNILFNKNLNHINNNNYNNNDNHINNKNDNNNINNNHLNNKNNINIKQKEMESLFLRNESEGEIESRYINYLNLNNSLDDKYNQRKSSELLNNDSTDSNDSINKINRSMFLLNSFNFLPDKDFYSIHKVIKVIKRDKKHKKRNKKE